MVTTVAIITNVIPSYREGFYDRLFSRDDLLVDVYCQTDIPGINHKTIHDKYPANVKIVTALSVKGEALVWQFMPWRRILFGYDVVFVDGNPRILSHALAATVLRLSCRNVVLWTMARSYRANKFTERTRLLWTRIFDRLFVYTDAEALYLRQNGFAGHDIGAMNNGLDHTKIDSVICEWDQPRLDAWRKAIHLESRSILLSCARLNPKNKFEQVIDALPAIVRRVPNVIWCVIGNGIEAGKLASLVRQAGLDGHVRFVGELYDERDLAPWFLSAAVLVHPGAIGLSILHAFGYGLLVVTHGNAEHHGPEFAAFEEGLSGRTFRENDVQSLATTIIGLSKDEPARNSMKAYVQHVARTQYNADVMVDRFVEMAKRATRVSRYEGL
jgi:glycosyltransferase involved in cell wall biosynthesis